MPLEHSEPYWLDQLAELRAALAEGRYADGLKASDAAFRSMPTAGGPDVRLGILYRCAGEILLLYSHFEPAIDLARKALAICQGAGHKVDCTAEIARAFLLLGRALQSHGDGDEAETYLHQATFLAEGIREAESALAIEAEIATIMLMLQTGPFFVAENLLADIAERATEMLGPNHPVTCRVQMAYAEWELAVGENESARQRSQRVLRVLEVEKGPDALLTTEARLLVQDCRARSGAGLEDSEIAAAEAALIEALDEDAPFLNARFLRLRCQLERLRGNEAGMDLLQDQALALIRKRWGEEHALGGLLYREMALEAGQRGHFAEAGRLERLARNILERTMGPEFPELEPLLMSMASTHAGEGNYESAGEFLARAVAVKRKALGARFTKLGPYGAVLVSWVRKAEAEERLEDARALARRGVLIARGAIGPEARETRELEGLLGTAGSPA
ncbi:MAG: hypothetical protein RLY93_05875 [Sumerlaeia bacterium]